MGTVQIFVEDLTLHLVGAFDVRSTGEVREAIYRRLDACEGIVVIDLSEVEAVDLTALKVLAVATRRASREGTSLRVRGCGPHVTRMLHVSRMARLIDVDREPVAA